MARVLVVGDVVIDQHSLLQTVQAPSSSSTSRQHYVISRARRTLCGAGLVARMIAETEASDSHAEVGLLGSWDRRDRELLRHLLHPVSDECGASTHTLDNSRGLCSTPTSVNLFPISNQPRSTLHVTRHYRKTVIGIEQFNRFDWPGVLPPQVPPEEVVRVARQKLKGHTFDVIVVNDLGKGTVSPELIEALQYDFKTARWVVRTKVLSRLRGAEEFFEPLVRKKVLELFLVGPELATEVNPFDSWMIGRRLTDIAIDALEHLPGRHVVILAGNRRIVGRLNNRELAIAGTCAAPAPRLLHPSSALATLTHELVMRHFGRRAEDASAEDVSAALSRAEDLTDRFPGVDAEDLENEDEDEVPTATRGALGVRSAVKWRVTAKVLADEATEWHDAKRDLGIIQDGTRRAHLAVWRAETQVPGYIALMQAKREILTRLGAAIRSYVSSEPRRSLSIRVQADPGAGKSVLARRLAGAFKLELIEANIAQMTRREDLLDLFDAVATRQQEHPNEKLLVFVDEIDGEIEDSNVYDAFLAPLEEGYYWRGTKKSSLRPSVWLFVGGGGKPGANQVSDFRTRIGLDISLRMDDLRGWVPNEVITLGTQRQNDPHEDAQLEQVYLIAAIIGAEFKDAQSVERRVLQHFSDADPAETNSRTIRKWAEEHLRVANGVVRDVKKSPDQDLVRIEHKASVNRSGSSLP